MKKLYRIYVSCLTLMLMLTALTVPALAVDDMWTVANTVIVDVWNYAGVQKLQLYALLHGCYNEGVFQGEVS